MYYDEFEYYYEPSKADEIIERAVAELKETLKGQALSEMDTIKHENERLKKELDEYHSKEQELRNREFNIAQKENNLKREFNRAKFRDLIEPFIENETIYVIDRVSKLIPKCDKCNENRRIEYISKYGDKTELRCECDKNKTFYYPTMKELKSIEFAKGNGKFRATPRYSRDYEYEYFHIDFKEPPIEEYDPELDISYSRDYFSNREVCQKYCDDFNKENGWDINE
jgi:hypothetical protein